MSSSSFELVEGDSAVYECFCADSAVHSVFLLKVIYRLFL